MNSLYEDTRARLILDIPNMLKFIRQHDGGIFENYSDAKMINVICQHINYGTLVVLYDENGIYALERYNIINDRIFYSIDTVIRPDRRSRDTLKALFKQGVEESPFRKTARFILYEKGQHMELGYRVHDIEKFLGNGKYKLNRGG